MERETISIGHDRWYASQCGKHLDIFERPTRTLIRTICIHEPSDKWAWSIAPDGTGVVIVTFDRKGH